MGAEGQGAATGRGIPAAASPDASPPPNHAQYDRTRFGGESPRASADRAEPGQSAAPFQDEDGPFRLIIRDEDGEGVLLLNGDAIRTGSDEDGDHIRVGTDDDGNEVARGFSEEE